MWCVRYRGGHDYSSGHDFCVIDSKRDFSGAIFACTSTQIGMKDRRFHDRTARSPADLISDQTDVMRSMVRMGGLGVMRNDRPDHRQRGTWEWKCKKLEWKARTELGSLSNRGPSDSSQPKRRTEEVNQH